MSVWDSYYSRLHANGATLREAQFNAESRYLTDKIRHSLSYHTVQIDGHERNVSVINSDNLNQKLLLSMPGEDIDCGALVRWMDNYWLVIAKDANNELYTRSTMLQCNHELKWISDGGIIVRQWCVVEDGTKYLTGETQGAYNDIDLYTGDTRITVRLPRNKYTIKITRNTRFLIDDPQSPNGENVFAYRVTKPYKVGGVYNGKGVMSFVLVEENTTYDDNLELRIADYYKFFPREQKPDVEPEEPPIVPDDPEVDPDADPDVDPGTEPDTDPVVPPAAPPTTNGKKVWL